jgi:hypothetical protein
LPFLRTATIRLETVPEPRKESESRPILLTTAFDLHLYDRGSVGFPVETGHDHPADGTLFRHERNGERAANVTPTVWRALKSTWGILGELSESDARSLSRGLARLCLAVCHSPSYQEEHKESLAQDWAHIPIPKSKELFDEFVEAGDQLAILLNPIASPTKVLKHMLGDELRYLAVPAKVGGANLDEDDLVIEYSFFGGTQGAWRERADYDEEPMHDEWGASTGDLYINDSVFFRHVPERVWRYELGGYPVIKKGSAIVTAEGAPESRSRCRKLIIFGVSSSACRQCCCCTADSMPCTNVYAKTVFRQRNSGCEKLSPEPHRGLLIGVLLHAVHKHYRR